MYNKPLIVSSVVCLYSSGTTADDPLLSAHYGYYGQSGSSSILVVVGGMQDDPLPQQVKTGSSIHLPFDQLQLVDLPFHLPVAPRQR